MNTIQHRITTKIRKRTPKKDRVITKIRSRYSGDWYFDNASKSWKNSSSQFDYITEIKQTAAGNFIDQNGNLIDLG